MHLHKVQHPVLEQTSSSRTACRWCTPASTTPPVLELAFWSSMACCWARCARTDGGGGCVSCFCFSKKSVRIDLSWYHGRDETQTLIINLRNVAPNSMRKAPENTEARACP